MAAISYLISLGQTVEQITSGTAAPTGGGQVEIRMDQSATTVTDAQSTTGTRALKKGEILALLVNLQQMLIKDTTIAQ